MELCGGTHANRTGDIGVFKILSESSVAAGVRRIEAVTGTGALTFIREEEDMLREAAALLRIDSLHVPERIAKLQEDLKAARKEAKAARAGGATGGAVDQQLQAALEGITEVGGIKVLTANLELPNPKDLRGVSDRLMDKLRSGILVIGCQHNGAASLVVKVSKDLTSRYSAGELIKALAPVVGGKGGGRPDMAQAGGRDGDKLPDALAKVYELVG